MRGVNNIEDEETAIVSFFGCDPDRISPSGSILLRSINLDNCIV